MKIYNNVSAMTVLNEADRNQKKRDKALKQLGLGEKITSAGDDASGYAISERMRVKLRGLNQDEQNVKNGASMLRVAEGAIQSQINLLRTVKEKTIDAANDTNTDADRLIIQKEIDHCYEEINDISAETTYNGKHLLIGDAIAEKFGSWVVLDHAELVEDSDTLNLFPDAFTTLDGQEGPFDTFGSASDSVPYDGYNLKTISAATLAGYDTAAATDATKSYLHDGTSNTANKIEIDLSSYADIPKALDNTSFSVRYPYSSTYSSYTFVLTTDTSRKYRAGIQVDISGCTTGEQVIDKIKTAFSSKTSIKNAYAIETDGSKLTMTVKIPSGKTGTYTNNKSYYDVTSSAQTGGTYGGSTNPGRTAAPKTGLALGSFSGGADAVYETKIIKNPDDTVSYTSVLKTAATKAANTIAGISGVANGTGITLNGYNSSGYSTTSYLVFKDGSGGLTDDSANGYYTIGKDYTGTVTLGGFTLKFSGGNLTLTSGYAGAKGNSSSISDGVTAVAKTTTPSGTYTATTALAASAINNTQSGKNGDTAHWDIDLSGYDTTDTAKAEEFIASYSGKAVYHSNYGGPYEFIDTGSDDKLDGVSKTNNATTLDLNKVRTAVAGGSTVAEAFAKLITSKLSSFASIIHEDPADAASKIVGVQFKASIPGTEGNKQYIYVKEGDLRSYTVDFNGVANAETLDGKGFRFYCATDPSQWVNVAFYNGLDGLDDKPASGTGSQDIDTLIIDVSGISNTKDFVKLLDEKLGDYLENKYKHFFHLVAEPDKGTVTIYDSRRYTLLNRSDYPDKQEKGAKIADGVLDNVVMDYRYLYVKDLYIQHTTKANQNIHIQIPQTSMDQIFGYKIGTHTIDEYNVLTKDMRDKLLGDDETQGILDAGLQYLIDANTLIGAQINHMEFAEKNIVTESENVAASESVIRDTDMAKAMMEFTKFNILAQASQTMLSQANHNPETIMSLLQ